MSADMALQKQHSILTKAWSLYHHDFSDNAEDVVSTINETYLHNLNAITPANLNSAVRLFKDLDFNDEAYELISKYVQNRNESHEFWDLNSHHFFPGDVSDPDIVNAFNTKHEAMLPEINTIEVLKGIAKDRGWSNRTILHLTSVSEDQYFEIFKNNTGDDLDKILKGALSFRQISNASPEMNEITKRVVAALKRIGAECEINSRRIQKYGIDTVESDVN